MTLKEINEKQYRKSERLLNDFRNNRIGYEEAIEQIEKAIRESVEEALLEVRPKFNYEYDGRSCFFEADFESRVKEFMK